MRVRSVGGWVPRGPDFAVSCALFAAAAGPMTLFERLGTVGAGLVLVFLVLSLGVHEAAHAWVALLCGDSTAKEQGRLTLDPRPHIDPIMTVLLPVVMMATTGFLFGGAKPVPVAYHRLRNPLRDMMFVALAGPLSNVLLAILFAAIRGLVLRYTPHDDPAMLTPRILQYAVFFNLLLAIFNMIPLPPLDGSRVMTWLLPESLRSGYVSLERFGFMLIVLLFMTNVFSWIIGSALPGAWDLVNALTGGGAGSL